MPRKRDVGLPLLKTRPKIQTHPASKYRLSSVSRYAILVTGKLRNTSVQILFSPCRPIKRTSVSIQQS